MATEGKQATETAKAAPARRRRAILDRLKQEGPQDAGTLAAGLGVSAMAVRQHLYDLQEQGLVAYEEEARPLGRPAKLWRLTPDADAFFPDGHAELTLSLLAAMGEAFGGEGLERLLAVRTREQIAAYRQRIGPGRPLPERLRRLAELRSEEGYMAAVEPQDDGSFLLVENHCPICAAAAACTGLCAAELAVFRATLGDDVSVERTDHILAGARRCAYRVRPRA
ncbi:MAG: helix-turn-helix transcriptional regulator [Kiloniellales bacterium]